MVVPKAALAQGLNLCFIATDTSQSWGGWLLQGPSLHCELEAKLAVFRSVSAFFPRRAWEVVKCLAVLSGVSGSLFSCSQPLAPPVVILPPPEMSWFTAGAESVRGCCNFSGEMSSSNKLQFLLARESILCCHNSLWSLLNSRVLQVLCYLTFLETAYFLASARVKASFL